MMNTLLMEKSKQHNVNKFVGINTVNAYPQNVEMPLKEKDLWMGKPEKNVSAYVLSKRMLIFQSEVYYKQFDFNSINLLFDNIYGPYVDFNLETARVIPATIIKCLDAKAKNKDSIVMWGTGNPVREFLYVEDALKKNNSKL